MPHEKFGACVLPLVSLEKRGENSSSRIPPPPFRIRGQTAYREQPTDGAVAGAAATAESNL